MNKLQLVVPDNKYQKGFNEFYQNYKDSGEEMVPFVLKFYKGSFEKF